jgi:hypothetical protein
MNTLVLLHPLAWIAGLLFVRGGIVLVRDGVLRPGPRCQAAFLLGLGLACVTFIQVTSDPVPVLSADDLRHSLASARLVDIASR